MITLKAEQNGERREAWFSPCMEYRYMLDIVWDQNLPLMTSVCLNPSTASHLIDDRTISRCKAFARDWGFGGHRMLNAFAFRSTDRMQLFKRINPIGIENTIDFLREHAVNLSLAAWGTTITSKSWNHRYRGHDIAHALDLHCYRITPSGHPEHPLYLPKSVSPEPFKYL